MSASFSTRVSASRYAPDMARKTRGRKSGQEGRREFLKLLPAYIAAGAAVVGVAFTERREAARDYERRIEKISARLEETVKQVLAAPVPPVGSGR